MALMEKIVADTLVMNKRGQRICNLSIAPESGPTSTNSRAREDVVDRVVVTLCKEALSKKQQVLLFMPTKHGCVVACALIADALRHCEAGGVSNTNSNVSLLSDIADNSNSLEQQQSLKISAGRAKATEELLTCNKCCDPRLRSSILVGVAYHHAGLTQIERLIVEDAFREGFIDVLVATSTLAAGVNLPAGRVIIRSLQLGVDALDVVHYKQMVSAVQGSILYTFIRCIYAVICAISHYR